MKLKPSAQSQPAATGSGRRRWFVRGLLLVCLGAALPWPAMAAEEPDSAPPQWTIHGFIESENWVNTYPDQTFADAVKKTELRQRLEAKYGTEDLYLFMASDLYLHPDLVHKGDGVDFDYRYSAEPTVARNLRLSGDRYDWAFNEFYAHYMISPLRLRLGNQMLRWGTADVFNPTAYFNAYDFREFLFRDSDEFRQGVPSLSAMHFADAFTTEWVLSFVHVPMLFSPPGNFWSVDMQQPLYALSVQPSDGMDIAVENMGVGARVSTNLLDADVSLSAYRGPDREPVQVPSSIDYLPNQPLVVQVIPHYDIVHMLGLDFSKAAGDFVFQFEGAYSPDKPNFVTQDISDLASVRLPFELCESNYVSYAAGFNYFVPIRSLFENHGGEMVFTLDWFQSLYLDSAVARPFLSDILTLRLQDSYWDGRILLNLTTMFETRHGGAIFWPKIKYDFQNGWSAELAYAAIEGSQDSEAIEPLFYHFRDNDVVMIRARYEF
jgi:hypothetical protein